MSHCCHFFKGKLRHRELKKYGQDHRITTLSQLMATHPSCPSAVGKVDSEAAVFRIILMLLGTDHICRGK